MKAWVAGWNAPGRLPDVEPQRYGTWDEAVNVLITEVGYRSLSADAPMVNYRTASATLRSARRDEPLSFYYAGTVWWIADLSVAG